MSIKVSTQVWDGSLHKSSTLVVLLRLADHADDDGFAWPGIKSLSEYAGLTQRHTRRCLKHLVESRELEILPGQAPSGGPLYKIRLDQLRPDRLCRRRTSRSDKRTPGSASPDTAVQPSLYIEEPSSESSKEPSSKVKIKISNPKNPNKQQHSHFPDAVGLVSLPKSGF